jgi:hypothetical protein
MSVDGSWKITVNSPMGKQEAALDLKADGSTLTGTQSAQEGNSQPIKDGKVDGDNVSWSCSITTPFPMTLKFTGIVSGDSIKGKVKAAAFSSFDFEGTKA